ERLFFFLNYEGTRRIEQTSVINAVPSAALRDGVIQYQCQLLADGSPDTTTCPGGTAQGVSGKTYNIAPGTFGLSAQNLVQIDPLHVGANTAALTYLNTY